MHQPLVFLCLALCATLSHGAKYKLPTIYTPVTPVTYDPPVSQPIQPWPYQLPYFQQFQTPQQPIAPIAQPIPTQSPALYSFPPISPFSNYFPINQQSQSQSLYPPNSFVLVYYRPKAAASQANPQHVPLKPRIEPPANKFSDICKGEGIVPHPDDCLKFFRCKLSLRHQVYFYEERSCPQGLAFDRKLESCNYQFKVAGCKSQYSHTHHTVYKAPATSSYFPTHHATQPTQTLLTYHGELPEPGKDTITDKVEESSNDNPTLYMMELPQPLNEPSDDSRKQDFGADSSDNTNLESVPLMAKNSDYGLKTVTAPTKGGTKKPSGTKTKSPSRKVSTKRPSGTKSAGTKSRPVVQQREPESFSIGDSSESARMVVDSAPESTAAAVPEFGQRQVKTVYEPVPAQESPVAAVDDKLVPEVRYEDDDNGADEIDNAASTV